MNEQHCLHFSVLPMGMRVLYTSTLVVTGFAWVVLVSGTLMGLAFAAAVFISLFQLWFYKLPDGIIKQGGVVS